jgi:hypothetical protein
MIIGLMIIFCYWTIVYQYLLWKTFGLLIKRIMGQSIELSIIGTRKNLTIPHSASS